MYSTTYLEGNMHTDRLFFYYEMLKLNSIQEISFNSFLLQFPSLFLFLTLLSISLFSLTFILVVSYSPLNKTQEAITRWSRDKRGHIQNINSNTSLLWYYIWTKTIGVCTVYLYICDCGNPGGENRNGLAFVEIALLLIAIHAT